MSFLRTKYKELLSNFDELQSEKTAIQQQFESASSNAKAILANMKVCIVRTNVVDYCHVDGSYLY